MIGRETGHPAIAVVVPVYGAQNEIIDVLENMPKHVTKIFVVDDACPNKTGAIVVAKTKDPRVEVIFNKKNLGVGGATIIGYQKALQENYEIIIKLDGDGQMDPSQIPALIQPIVDGEADYTKGNRFDSLEDLEQMPKVRIFGNAGLSLMSKLSTGYWDINDPTNGYTAIHRSVLARISLPKVRKTFFFESDMLFRLSLIRAVVVDVPMQALYGSETSNLSIRKALGEFPRRHAVNFFKRIFYNYYLREWNIASIELPISLLLMGFGVSFGISTWASASSQGVAATSAQALLAALPIILGFQLFLAFLSFDVSSIPRRAKSRT